MPTEAKVPPSIWVTSLPNLIIGENSCEWRAWLQAHYWKYERKPFDNPKWMIEHTELLNKLVPEFKAKGAVVTREKQNRFELPGSVGSLAGNPDLVATFGDSATIIEAKSTQPGPEHRVQLLIYLWALPQVGRWKGMQFEGLLAYPDHRVSVSPSEIDESFTGSLRSLLRRVGATLPAMKVPSMSECRFCPIAKSECPERVETEEDGQNDKSDF